MATQENVGQHLDLSREQIRKLVNAGVIPTGKGRAGYDVDLCRVAYIRHLRGVKSGEVRSADDQEPADYAIEKTRLTAAQADHEELKVQQLEHRLIPREVVAAHWQAVFAAARAKLLALPTKIAHAALAAEKLSEVDDAARVQVYEALDELANGGIPDGYELVDEGDGAGLEASAESDGESVGGSESEIKQRGKRRTRTVAH